MSKRLVATLLLIAASTAALAQGVPVNDSGLTARDLIETADREADLALQREKLTVEEQITEIERQQLAVLDAILDAQTSFDSASITGIVSDLESGRGASNRSVEAVYGTADIDPNPAGDQMFGDAAANIEGLIIRDGLLEEVGPAVCSGKSIFMYGPPGNGKSSIAELGPDDLIVPDDFSPPRA